MAAEDESNSPLKRHEALQPFSREHMSGLIQARNLVRAARGGTASCLLAVQEFLAAWRAEIRDHFDDEEKLLLPLCASSDLGDRLKAEHLMLRQMAQQCERDPDAVASECGFVRRLGELLHDHIRWEERVLFQSLQATSPKNLAALLPESGRIHARRPGSRPRRVAEDAGSIIEAATTLAIIAGGAGSRMGGPKHRLVIRGRPTLHNLLDRLNWRGPTLLVLADQGTAVEGQQRVDHVVVDGVPGEGPLQGILAALEACRTAAILAVPIDMPGLGREQTKWFLAQAKSESCGIFFLRRQVATHRVVEPFPLFVRSSSTEQVRAQLARGQRSVRSLADLPEARVLDAPTTWSADVWDNLNTPNEAAKYGAELSSI